MKLIEKCKTWLICINIFILVHCYSSCPHITIISLVQVEELLQLACQAVLEEDQVGEEVMEGERLEALMKSQQVRMVEKNEVVQLTESRDLFL